MECLEVKSGILPRIHICPYILGNTKRQLSGSQNRIRADWVIVVHVTGDSSRRRSPLQSGSAALGSAARTPARHVHHQEGLHARGWGLSNRQNHVLLKRFKSDRCARTYTLESCSSTCSVHDCRAPPCPPRLEDLQLFGWELSAAEMAAISKLDVAPDDPVKGMCLFKKKQP